MEKDILYSFFLLYQLQKRSARYIGVCCEKNEPKTLFLHILLSVAAAPAPLFCVRIRLNVNTGAPANKPHLHPFPPPAFCFTSFLKHIPPDFICHEGEEGRRTFLAHGPPRGKIQRAI